MSEGEAFSLAALGATPKHLSSREVLFREGGAATTVAQVLSGRLALRRHLADGTVLTIDVLGPGDLAADGALTRARFGCEASALGPATVALMSTRRLRQAIANDVTLAISLIDAMAGRVHRLRTRLALRSIRPARRRVLAALALETGWDRASVATDRPLAEFAGTIGLSAPAFYRTLAALEKTGEIRRVHGRIVLCPVSLEDEASGPDPA